MLRFDDIFIDYTRLGRKIPKEKYLQKGKHIIIDQGQNDIAGYSNEEDGIFSDIPVIIFGDHTRIFKLIKSPFFLGADGTKILKAKISNMSYDYLYYYLKYKKIPNTGYNRHFKWLKELTFEIKDFNEQEKISTVLNKVSKILEMKKQQLSEFDKLVKFQFLKIFGDPILNEKNWKTEKLFKVAPITQYIGKFDEKIWLLNLDMIEANTGKIIKYNYTNLENIPLSTYKFSEENVLYSKLRPYLNKVVIPNNRGYVTSEMLPLKPNPLLLNRYFFAYLLRCETFVDFIKNKVSGTKMPRVSMEELKQFDCILPPIELQNKFADFVKQVDKSKVILGKALKSLSFRLNYYYML